MCEYHGQVVVEYCHVFCNVLAFQRPSNLQTLSHVSLCVNTLVKPVQRGGKVVMENSHLRSAIPMIYKPPLILYMCTSPGFPHMTCACINNYITHYYLQEGCMCPAPMVTRNYLGMRLQLVSVPRSAVVSFPGYI